MSSGMTGMKKGRGTIVSAADFQFSTVIWRVSTTFVANMFSVQKLKEDLDFFALSIILCQVVGYIGKIFGSNSVPHCIQLLEKFRNIFA